jgi:hypothetical protein
MGVILRDENIIYFSEELEGRTLRKVAEFMISVFCILFFTMGSVVLARKCMAFSYKSVLGAVTTEDSYYDMCLQIKSILIFIYFVHSEANRMVNLFVHATWLFIQVTYSRLYKYSHYNF